MEPNSLQVNKGCGSKHAQFQIFFFSSLRRIVHDLLIILSVSNHEVDRIFEVSYTIRWEMMKTKFEL